MSKDKIIKNLTEENALLKEAIKKLESKIEALERNEKIYLEALSLARKSSSAAQAKKLLNQSMKNLDFLTSRNWNTQIALLSLL